jgi:hypothetical protein
MKNSTKSAVYLVLSFLFVFLLTSNISACTGAHKNYGDLDSNDGVIFIVYDNNVHGDDVNYYDNQNRYPISTYAYGYTARSDRDYYYQNSAIARSNYYPYSHYNYRSNQDVGPNWLFNGEKDYVVYQDQPNYYYVYNSYMGSYELHTCYINPPSNKLIYTKCP